MTDAQNAGSLAGKRILVVEDEAMIWMLIEDSLVQNGCQAIGPLSRIEEALRAAETETADAALLDLNLAGTASYPVADMLIRRGIPFGFLTGYGAASLNEAYRRRPVLQKPFTEKTLMTLVSALVASPRQ